MHVLHISSEVFATILRFCPLKSVYRLACTSHTTFRTLDSFVLYNSKRLSLGAILSEGPLQVRCRSRFAFSTGLRVAHVIVNQLPFSTGGSTFTLCEGSQLLSQILRKLPKAIRGLHVTLRPNELVDYDFFLYLRRRCPVWIKYFEITLTPGANIISRTWLRQWFVYPKHVKHIRIDCNVRSWEEHMYFGILHKLPMTIDSVHIHCEGVPSKQHLTFLFRHLQVRIRNINRKMLYAFLASEGMGQQGQDLIATQSRQMRFNCVCHLDFQADLRVTQAMMRNFARANVGFHALQLHLSLIFNGVTLRIRSGAGVYEQCVVELV